MVLRKAVVTNPYATNHSVDEFPNKDREPAHVGTNLSGTFLLSHYKLIVYMCVLECCSVLRRFLPHNLRVAVRHPCDQDPSPSPTTPADLRRGDSKSRRNIDQGYARH